MSETVNIAVIADKITDDIFKWFKWNKIARENEDFPCTKGTLHKNGKKRDCLTHPVDVVYSYFDPYLNKKILLNTDLKSYAVGSITTDSMRKAIKSLANTIDCANSSEVWKSKYTQESDVYEIRALLFVYNHDNEYDKIFYDNFNDITLESLITKKDQILHILEPKRIRYMFNIVSDLQRLISNETFPKDAYSFFYPELHLHKASGDIKEYPANIESLTAPYLIVTHEDVVKIEETSPGEFKKTIIYNKGYIIYYNRDGSTKHEFMYLFDTLSRFQIINEQIRIRVAHDEPNELILTNYRSAIDSYIEAWGADTHKKQQLESINIELLPNMVQNYRPAEMGWRAT